MSGLLNINEEVKVFKCPNCNEYISSNNDLCPKCSFQITNEAKQSSIKTQEAEVKKENRKFYTPIILGGVGLLAFGTFRLLLNLNNLENFSIRSLALIIAGLGLLIWGLNGLRKER